MRNIKSLSKEAAGTIAEALEELNAYEEKTKAGHTFTVEDVERVKALTIRVQEIKLKPNRATKRKRKKRK